MYSVLLVDDEIWSLDGLRMLFDWDKMGFHVIDQVTDSSEAFDIIRSTKPDVVFTDIRMPEISGIELLSMSRQEGIASEFVIISGFAEFEYAQDALRFGAFDYHLKPIDPDMALPLLEKLKLRLQQKEIERSMNIYKELTLGLSNSLEILKTNHFVPSG
ncbi:MAG: response regulator [Paenibacillaceae bacterium]